MIDGVVKQAMKDNLNGVYVNFDGIDNEQNFERFLIELAPRLREIGQSTCVKMSSGMNEDNIKNIVDYIVN